MSQMTVLTIARDRLSSRPQPLLWGTKIGWERTAPADILWYPTIGFVRYPGSSYAFPPSTLSLRVRCSGERRARLVEASHRPRRYCIVTCPTTELVREIGLINRHWPHLLRTPQPRLSRERDRAGGNNGSPGLGTKVAVSQRVLGGNGGFTTGYSVAGTPSGISNPLQ